MDGDFRMVVRSVNGVFPDFSGNVNTKSEIALYTENGLVTEPVKMFTGVATTATSDGTFSLNISTAGFSVIYDVKLTVQAGSFSQANAPLSANVGVVTNTQVNGKAFKATSAGLLTAMQQTPVESGTKINVLVIGH